MDEQPNKSKNIIDRRSSVATHTSTGVLGIIIGILMGHPQPPAKPDPQRGLVQVTSTALDRGQTFWSTRVNGWKDARVVFIDHDEPTQCGTAGKLSGPFYCPPSQKIYLDLSFLETIQGELARAYVTAHEIGHHVQALRGEFAGRSSIDVELQADCYAGMWMKSEQDAGHLAPGDIEAALAEASAVGDDRICPTCSSEQWTHGSAAQRSHALQTGLSGGSCS